MRKAWIRFISPLVLSCLVIGGCGTGDLRGSGKTIDAVERTVPPGGEPANSGMSPEEIGRQALDRLRSGRA